MAQDSLNKEDFDRLDKLSKSNPPPKVTNQISYERSRIGNEAGALIFQTNQKVDEHGSAIPQDLSYIQLQDKFNSYINLAGGEIAMKSNSNFGIYATSDYFQFVGRDAQYVYNGNKYEYIKGNHVLDVGNWGKKEQEASKKLNQIADEISNEGVKTIEKVAESGEGGKIACHVCGLTVAVDRTSMVGTAFKYIRKIFNVLPNSPFGGTLDKIEAVIKKVVAFFLDEMSVSALNGGSCGCSGCEDNSISSPAYALDKGNEAMANKFKEKKKEIEELEKKLSAGSSTTVIPNDVKVHVGGEMRTCETVALGKPYPLITELQDGNPKYCFIPSSKGTVKQAIYTTPTKTSGNESRTVANSYELKVGSGGIDVATSGKQKISGATIEVTTSKGELLLNSPNKTIIGGANIVLQSKGNQNGDAIILDSDRTYVGGKLSVQGDIALKGSLMMDGGIYAPHLTVPGERVDSDVSSAAHNVHSSANWNNPVKPDATSMDTFDKLYKVFRDVCAGLTELVLTPDYIKTVIEETYSTTQINSTIDNTGLPTGYAWVMDYYTYMPLDIVGTCSYGGSLVKGVSYVVPAMIPIHNYTHNHGSPGDPHVHAYTMPKCITHGNAAASIASRQPASSIPTPAQTTGMGQEPGHKNAGSLGPCGGGGGPFGNMNRVNSAKLRRNQAYGINSVDAFGGKDYVDTTQNGVTVKYNEDGTISPDPDFYLPTCD